MEELAVRFGGGRCRNGQKGPVPLPLVAGRDGRVKWDRNHRQQSC